MTENTMRQMFDDVEQNLQNSSQQQKKLYAEQCKALALLYEARHNNYDIHRARLDRAIEKLISQMKK